ncbi:hypothetical protein BT69DRAFT_1230767 [Atractiella rhizophila]|nr:hypothetical protein BT69DRAFT_1230767 [Atractiella rhizophila]
MKFGNLTFPTVTVGYQASGVLQLRCGEERAERSIPYCYSLYLADNSALMLEGDTDRSARQRSEFLFPYQADGDTRHYEYTMWLSSETGSSENFFHLFQLFSHGDSGPVITLDYYLGTIVIRDHKRECAEFCPFVPAQAMMDKSIRHIFTITYGPLGRFSYVAQEVETGEQIMAYEAAGWMGTDRQTYVFATTLHGYVACNYGVMADD